MRRVIPAILLCLLLGLLTSIALAWAAALEMTQQGFDDRLTESWVGVVEREPTGWLLRIRRPAPLEMHRPPSGYDTRAPQPLKRLVETPASPQFQAAEAMISGWPIPSWSYIRRLEQPRFISHWDYANHGALRGYNPLAEAPKSAVRAEYLPMRPWWPGLLSSTALFALCWFVIPLAGYLYRFAWARRRGTTGCCTFCGYDLRGQSGACPECGRDRSQRQPPIGRNAVVFLVVAALLAFAAVVAYGLSFRAGDPVPAIIAASYDGDADRVRQLLDDGADPELIYETIVSSGMASMPIPITPLIAASTSGDVETVEALLDGGANPNTIAAPFSPLGMAAETGNFEAADFLIERGADPNLDLGRGMSLLSPPAMNGNVKALRYLIGKGADARGDDIGMMSAVRRGDHEAIDLLLARGAEPRGGILMAVRRGDLQLFEKLRKHGIVPCQSGGDALLFKIRDEGYNEQLFDALIESGIDVNARNADGRTVLMEKALNGEWRCAWHLLQRGADPNLIDPKGSTALSAALNMPYKMSEFDALMTAFLLLAYHADTDLLHESDLQQTAESARTLIESVRSGPIQPSP